MSRMFTKNIANCWSSPKLRSQSLHLHYSLGRIGQIVKSPANGSSSTARPTDASGWVRKKEEISNTRSLRNGLSDGEAGRRHWGTLGRRPRPASGSNGAALSPPLSLSSLSLSLSSISPLSPPCPLSPPSLYRFCCRGHKIAFLIPFSLSVVSPGPLLAPRLLMP